MNITAKSRYALKIMMDLAATHHEGIQQRHLIAKRQGVPLDFMDQITARLRNKGLILSSRGRKGGFQLGKPAEEINVWDILQAVEDQLYPVRCIDSELSCDFEENCISYDAWSDIIHCIQKELSQKKLSTMTSKWLEKEHNSETALKNNRVTCTR